MKSSKAQRHVNSNNISRFSNLYVKHILKHRQILLPGENGTSQRMTDTSTTFFSLETNVSA